MTKRHRRQHSAEQKAQLVRQHRSDKKPVSEICSEAQIQPILFYSWQRELIAGAVSVFTNPRRAPKREKKLEEKVA